MKISANQTNAMTHTKKDMVVDVHHDDYEQLISAVQLRIQKVRIMLEQGGIYGLLRITGQVTELGNYSDFLSMLESMEDILGEDYVKVHDCRHCQHLIDTLGNIMLFHQDGDIEPLIWSEDVFDDLDDDNVFRAVVLSLCDKLVKMAIAEGAKVVPASLDKKQRNIINKSTEKEVGDFEHFFTGTNVKVFQKLNTIEMDEFKEMVATNHRVGFYQKDALWLRTAYRRLKNRSRIDSSTLDRIRKSVGLYDHMYHKTEFETLPKETLKQLAISAGYLHLMAKQLPMGVVKLNGTTLGNLIETSQEDVAKAIINYLSETNPLTHLRSDKASLEQTLKSEAYFEEHDLGDSLLLRVTTLPELKQSEKFKKLWVREDKEKQEEKKSVFAGVKRELGYNEENKQEENLSLNDFRKVEYYQFINDILPTLKGIQLRFKSTPYFNPGFITTQVNPEARSLFSWDYDEDPSVPSYGHLFTEVNVTGKDSTYPVEMVFRDPKSQVVGKHSGECLMFAIDNTDIKLTISDVMFHNAGVKIKTGNPMFPNFLPDELFEHRKVIERFNDLKENVMENDMNHVIFSVSKAHFNHAMFEGVFVQGVDADGDVVGYHIAM